MTYRYVDLNVPNLPDPKICAWLEANGIDPELAPAAQYAQVTDEFVIYQEFMRGPDGFKLPVHDSKGEACAWQKHIQVRPLVSPPEDHGL